MQIRALRRHHYFRRLKHQQKFFIDLKNKALSVAKEMDERQLADYIIN